MKLTIYCCLCTTHIELEVELTPGWKLEYATVENNAFCPHHAGAAAFREDQCPGCVGSWRECPMWDAFQYSTRRTFTDADAAALERGICPRRVNGTFVISPPLFQEMDLSEVAVAGGKAFLSAIREYIERYPDDNWRQRR